MNLSIRMRLIVWIAAVSVLLAGFSACDTSLTPQPTPTGSPSSESAVNPPETANPAVATLTSSLEPTAISIYATALDSSIEWIPQDGGIPVTSLSPDGLWTAEMIFSESRYLLQVERTDGSLTWLVADLRGPLSIDYPFPTQFRWSRDGRYLYYDGATSRDYIHPGTGMCDIGGVHVDLQRLDLESGEIISLNPTGELREFTISPNARTFAYLDPGWRSNLLTLRDLETGREKRLRFDVPSWMWTVSDMSWAPDESALAFTVVGAPCNQTRGHPTSLIVVDLRTGTARTVIAKDSDLGWQFEWVNSEVVLVHEINGDLRRIYVKDGSEVAGKSMVILSRDEGDELGWLSFIASSQGQLAVYAVRANGRDLKQLSGDLWSLFADTEHMRLEDWSPDGSWIAFAGLPRNGNDGDIYIARVDTLERRNLTDSPSMDGAPDWSPDGDQIAYFSRPLGWDSKPELYLIRVSEGEQAVPFHLTKTQTSDTQPVWSPDGSRIAFVRERRDHGTDLHILHLADSRIEQLTDNPNGEGYVAWSPDGKQIAFLSDVNGIPQVFVINSDGSDLTEVTKEIAGHLTVIHTSPIWSPDGKYIAYISTRDGQTGIYIARSDGTGEWLVIQMPVWNDSLYWGIPAGLAEP